MPGYNDLRKGKYAERALVFALEKTYTNSFAILQRAVTPEEFQKLQDRYIALVNNLQSSYDDRMYSLNSDDGFEKKLTPEQDKEAIEIIEEIVKAKEKAYKALGKGYDDFKGFYDNIDVESSKDGNLLEARYESQYLIGVNQNGGGPKVDIYSSDVIKKGLMGEKDKITGKHKGPYEPLMDYYQSTANLHKLEYVRQKYNEEGWTEENEKKFLEDLKAEQERLVDSFDRLYAIEDDGRYDQYLNNSLGDLTGKSGTNRSAYLSIGAVKGQIKAIENGWAQDELVVLGAIGRMEAHLEMVKKEFEEKVASAHKNKKLGEKGIDNLSPAKVSLWAEAVQVVSGEEFNRKVLLEYEDKLNKIKNAAWNKKITSLEDKEEIVNGVNKIVKEYKTRLLGGYEAYYKLNGGAAAAEKFIDNVSAKLALEKQKSVNKEMAQEPKNNEGVQNVEPKVINQEPEIYEFSKARDQVANEGFNGTKAERESKAKTALQAYAAQSSMEDKIFFYLSYAAMNTTNESASISSTTLELPYDMPKEEKDKLKQEADAKYQKVMDRRAEAGMHPINQTSEEEEECAEQIRYKLVLDMVGDGSRESVINSFKSFGIVNAININNQGKKFKAIYDSLDKNEPNREKKALYLAYKSQGHEAMMNGAISNFSSLGLVSVFEYGDDLGVMVQNKIFDNLKYDPDKTTFKDFFDKLGLTSDERQLFMTDNNCTEETKLYDYYKGKLVNEGQQNPTADDIYDSVKSEYTEKFKNIVLCNCLQGPTKYFDINYSDNMTINHYMNMLSLSDEQKTEFLQHYDAKPEDTVNDAFKKYIDAHEDIKNELEKENLGVKDFAKKMIGYELVSKRRKINALNEKYSDNMTVKEYLDIVQVNEFGVNDFLYAYDTSLDAKIKDVLLKDLSEQKEDNNAQITDEEIKAHANNIMVEMIEKQNESGHFITDKTVWGGMYIHFADNMEIFADKNIYMHGHIVNGGEGLVPKQKPKTESQKEFKEWVEKTGQKRLDDVCLDEQIDAFKQIQDIIYTKKAINLRNEDFVATYFDNVSPISNTTFLQGVITALEDTKTGKKWINSSKDRSSNSEKYETMLKAIKEYHEKLVDENKFDLAAVRSELKTACLNYISGKESVRSREFGKERFDVAMTVLYDIIPQKEFVQIINRVNGSRSPKDHVSLDTYKAKYEALFTAEANREEERQVQAENKYLTDMPESYKNRFENVLNVFGLEPKTNDTMEGIFDDFEVTFAKVEGKLPQIGKGINEHKLTNEDFAAIAYAGALSDAAVEHDSRYNKDADLRNMKQLVTAKDYTLAFFRNPIPAETEKYAEVVSAGRQAGVDALKEYEKGDKFLLASLLAAGIRHIAAMSRLSATVDENFICNGEMGRRMIEMLNRDPQLKNMVTNSTIFYSGINDDVSYIDTINQATKIYNKAMAAKEKLAGGVENNEEKQELITDIMMLKVLNSSKDMYHKNVEETLKTGKWKSIMKEIENKSIDEIDELLTNDYTPEKRNELIDAAYAKKGLSILIQKDYLRNDKLMLSITTDKSVDALRKSVKEVVKDSGIDKLPTADIFKKLNDNKLLAKLGNVTKTANKNSENIYVDRKVAANKRAQEKLDAATKRKATKVVKK